MADTTDNDLEALALQIGEAGSDGDHAASILAKGMSDGLMSLLSLLKGKDTIAPETDGGEDTSDGGDDSTSNVTDDDDLDAGDGEDGASGYEDMMMGRGDGFGSPANGDTFDVTEFVTETGQAIRVLVKGRKSDHGILATNARQASEMMTLLKSVDAKLDLFFQAQAQTQVPLVKAVVDMRTALLDAPEAVHNIRAGGAGHRPAAKPSDEAFIGGSSRAEGRALMKARRSGIIDEGQKRRFWLDRRFAVDDAENQALRAAVAAA